MEYVKAMNIRTALALASNDFVQNECSDRTSNISLHQDNSLTAMSKLSVTMSTYLKRAISLHISARPK